MNILYRIFERLAIGEMQFSDYFGDNVLITSGFNRQLCRCIL